VARGVIRQRRSPDLYSPGPSLRWAVPCTAALETEQSAELVSSTQSVNFGDSGPFDIDRRWRCKRRMRVCHCSRRTKACYQTTEALLASRLLPTVLKRAVNWCVKFCGGPQAVAHNRAIDLHVRADVVTHAGAASDLCKLAGGDEVAELDEHGTLHDLLEPCQHGRLHRTARF
jgi:hypothetical protein